MATLWSFAGIDIIVDSDAGKPQVKMSEHFVLDGTESVFHYFGYGSDTRTIGGHIMDNPSSSALEDLADYCKLGTAGALVSDQGSEGNWFIESFEYSRVRDISRTKPVWKFTMNLKKA
jgi:hypothetical protein